jgi:hypothetical protein
MSPRGWHDAPGGRSERLQKASIRLGGPMEGEAVRQGFGPDPGGISGRLGTVPPDPGHSGILAHDEGRQVGVSGNATTMRQREEKLSVDLPPGNRWACPVR